MGLFDNLLDRKLTRKEFIKLCAIAFAGVFGITGTLLELLSKAATQTASFEPEGGTITGSATKISDSSASGGAAVKFGSGNTAWSDTDPPWQLRSGESVNDNMPTGVNVVNYSDYSNSNARSFGQTLAAIRSAATAPYYVRMPAGTFHITDFSFAAGSGVGRGYQDVNSTKLFSGLIGAGADQTFVVMDPNVMTATQLAGVTSGSLSPDAMMAIYIGGSAQATPVFISGITFQGNFQQVISLSGLTGTAPAPYSGLYLTHLRSGSMVQYCRFQGFGFAATQSPPYELGAVSSNYSSWTLRRTEIDGRLASGINSAQPVSSGGLMWNYETNVSVVDSWLHHTRRSGWATHDHAPSEGGNANDQGVYYGKNFQVEHISDTTDSYAGSPLGFHDSNVEEVRNTFTYVQPRFTSSLSDSSHISIATSNTNTIANSISVTDPIIGNTAYNGCLVIRFVKTPNSYGTSPYYTLYQSGGFAALPLTVTNNGVTLAPVLSTSFNASTNTPAKNYVVIFS